MSLKQNPQLKISKRRKTMEISCILWWQRISGTVVNFTRTWLILPRNWIFKKKVDPLHKLIIPEPSWKDSRVSPEFPNQNLRQNGPEVPELWTEKWTDRQREITTLYIYRLNITESVDNYLALKILTTKF